ncbi:hypothetical protein SAMN05421805_104105 [Saccharopolyspora antimicrobica]|uniref:Uncharacterized protein n=1 Tax=Saccharopolyspora antimicrobica TaxID=455193 RepID=A0A1I4YEB2_9PSEU|nr:hypothetical protein [Saccharopolyspora antimicrobica]RKT82637.1 hypothetical protein ATL45_0890 [Saccharopolyspora antimicrobica]SFN36367.1 hypothetical protein SAMN05421805_104105 [Saccharopolyspora antimicrobica]
MSPAAPQPEQHAERSEESANPVDGPQPGSTTPSTANKAGKTNNGVQTGTFNGDYNVYNWYSGSQKPPLTDSRVSVEEIKRAEHHFVPCPGFNEAIATLQRNHLIFLRGDGTGRSLASVRLLVECGARSISRLNERRSFDSIRSSEPEWHEGYIWEGADRQWQKDVTGLSAQRVAEWAAQNGSFVVVITGNHENPELKKFEERLGKPNPTQVALSFLQSQHKLGEQEAEEVLDEGFRANLPSDSAPNEAEFVAIRAWEAHSGKRERDEALADTSRDLRNSVESWFREKHGTIEYAMIVAISVFENRTYDDVMASAEDLEELIAKSDFPDGVRLERRKIFEFSKSQILFNLSASTARHRHADGLDLYKETVHFRRSRWAQEAFRRAWQEYDLLRPVIVDWMAKQADREFRWYCAKALHDVLVNVPNSNPLEHINALARKQSTHANALAAEILGRFADDPGTKHLVEPMLRDWCSGAEGFHRKWTAALVYATDYGVHRPDFALEQLEKIGKSNARLHNAVKTGVMSLLDRAENRTLVLQALVHWTKPFSRRRKGGEQRDNLRTVGLDCAQAALGLARETRYLRSLSSVPSAERFGDPDARLVAILFRRVFLEERTRLHSLRTLLELCDYCAEHPTSPAARGLAQLIATVTPDLHMKSEHELFKDWRAAVPGAAHKVDRAFATLQLLHQRYSPRTDR